MKDETKTKRASRKLCVNCHERQALYRRRGNVRWQRGFNLCFRCHRSAANRFRLAPVFEAATPATTFELPLAA